jgi:nucleoside-diphosphate-sugar epimerase
LPPPEDDRGEWRGRRRAGRLQRPEADVSAAKRDLGYSPSVSVEEGLRLTIDSFRR